jgi:hydroxymethylglutaryl-CoA synthase
MSESTEPSPAGIASIGVQLPPLAMEIGELASLRGQEPEKYTVGLGCEAMALCPAGYDVVDLAVDGAAYMALRA